MSIIRRSSPFGELLTLRKAMDRWFEDAFVRPPDFYGGASDPQTLPLDIYATDDALVVEAALPGVKPEDVDITVHGDTLTITGTSSTENRSEDQGYLYQEVRRGTFTRTVTLPADLRADAATATFEHGLLRLSIPKAEEAKPRQIRIASSSEGTSRAVGSAASASGQQGASGGSGAGTTAAGSSAPRGTVGVMGGPAQGGQGSTRGQSGVPGAQAGPGQSVFGGSGQQRSTTPGTQG